MELMDIFRKMIHHDQVRLTSRKQGCCNTKQITHPHALHHFRRDLFITKKSKNVPNFLKTLWCSTYPHARQKP